MNNQSESIKELAAALSKAQGAFDHAKKDVENKFFSSRYADLASCIDAAKKPLADNGLAVIQITNYEGDITWLETKLIHNSGEWICSRTPIKPMKADPQSFGSAMTYMRRYAFCAITGIAAEDDDGNEASSPNKQKDNAEKKDAKAKYVPSDPVRPQKDAYVVPCDILPDGTLDYDEWATILDNKVQAAKDSSELSLINRANAKTLKAMNTDRPDLFIWFGEQYRKKSQSLA